MRPQFLAGVAMLAIGAAPAAAQDQQGSAILDRLNALEARVRQLEARNAELEAAAADAKARVEKVEVRTAKAVQPGVAPTFADTDGNFSFKPRGTLQVDHAAYNSRAGGYDYSSGTDIRRARFGFDGTAYRHFKWRIEGEFVKNQANLLDVYLAYQIKPEWTLTIGQHKAPYGLEANTSDPSNTFLERGMASNAFGAVGAERRVGLSLAYHSENLNAALGVFGSGEAVTRNAVTPDESYGINGRIVWEPVLAPGRIVHLGLSAFHTTNFPANSLTISERPNVRVDDGRIVSAAITGTNPTDGPATGVRDADYVGAEALLVHGPISVQAEYGNLTLNRFGGLPDANFDGFYVFGSWFATGEARSVKGGTVDKLRPASNFDPALGKWGAIEFAARYDQLDLTDISLSPLRRKATAITGAINWYFNPNTKLIFNYIRFRGTNSPLVVAPVAINGTTAKGDAFGTRLQFDF